MIVKLFKIAEIKIGYTLRAGSTNNTKKQLAGLVAAKDLDSNFENIGEIAISSKYDNFLKKGDILVKSRGNSATARVFDCDKNNCLAAATLLVVRLKTEDFIPEYVELVINTPRNQQLLKTMTSSTLIPTLKPSSLREIEIPVISLSEQEHLIKEFSLITRTEDVLKQYLANLQSIKTIMDNKFTEEKYGR